MKLYKLKKWRQLAVLIVLEAGSYWFVKPQNLALFFFFWAVVAFASLIYNIFKIHMDGSLMSIGTSSSDAYGGLASALMESQYKTKHTRKFSGGGLRDFNNWFYLILAVANGIIYWVVQ